MTWPAGQLRQRLPRMLHPAAWWAWAIGLAVAASRTTNPLLLALIVAVLGLVVATRRSQAPWARGYRFYLQLALLVVGIRIAFRIVFASGAAGGDHILFALPVVPMPAWYSGVQIGGPVSIEAILAAAVDGARLACLLCCIGAANTLANPKRALRLLPGALYELGVAVTVALTVAPQLVESAGRVRSARRLRGGDGRGLRLLRLVAIPVLHDALERSLRLAAAMDSRGYGRTGGVSRASRRVTSALLLAGLAALSLGGYGLLDPTVPHAAGVSGFAGGAVLCVAGLALGGRRIARTRYRPDPWRWPEWVVAGCGIGCAVVFGLGIGYDPAALDLVASPLRWPVLPVLPAAAIVVAALAAVAAPPVASDSAGSGSAGPAAGSAPVPGAQLVAGASR